MSFPNLTGQQLLDWWERTSAGWRLLLTQFPAALELPCDIRETQSVAGLLQHIVGAELRYAERLHGVLETPYNQIQFDSVTAIYLIHERARALLADLSCEHEDFWQESIHFQTRRGGTLSAPRRALFIHLVMHSIRHYAQLATLVRQHGIAPDWPMDYLFMEQPERQAST